MNIRHTGVLFRVLERQGSKEVYSTCVLRTWSFSTTVFVFLPSPVHRLTIITRRKLLIRPSPSGDSPRPSPASPVWEEERVKTSSGGTISQIVTGFWIHGDYPSEKHVSLSLLPFSRGRKWLSDLYGLGEHPRNIARYSGGLFQPPPLNFVPSFPSKHPPPFPSYYPLFRWSYPTPIHPSPALMVRFTDWDALKSSIIIDHPCTTWVTTPFYLDQFHLSRSDPEETSVHKKWSLKCGVSPARQTQWKKLKVLSFFFFPQKKVHLNLRFILFGLNRDCDQRS